MSHFPFTTRIGVDLNVLRPIEKTNMRHENKSTTKEESGTCLEVAEGSQGDIVCHTWPTLTTGNNRAYHRRNPQRRRSNSNVRCCGGVGRLRLVDTRSKLPHASRHTSAAFSESSISSLYTVFTTILAREPTWPEGWPHLVDHII
jgi:hypothetical protein